MLEIFVDLYTFSHVLCYRCREDDFCRPLLSAHYLMNGSLLSARAKHQIPLWTGSDWCVCSGRGGLGEERMWSSLCFIWVQFDLVECAIWAQLWLRDVQVGIVLVENWLWPFGGGESFQTSSENPTKLKKGETKGLFWLWHSVTLLQCMVMCLKARRIWW